MKLMILWMPLLLASCTKHNMPGKPTACLPADYSQHAHHRNYQQILEDYHNNDDAPGTLLALKKGTGPLWVGARGKANKETGADMTACTQFRTGSITKVFTAVIILQLKQEGKLRLDDKLEQWLPHVKNRISGANSISIRQLLNHTSGLTDPKNDDPDYLDQITNDPESIGSMTMAERLRHFVYDRPLLFPPGTVSHYSNAGYWLLGEIIERITRKSMQEVLQERIFRPVGMMHSYYEKRENPNVSKGYTFIGENLVEVSRWDAADGDADPSSGVISSAEDLIKFGFALFTGNLVTPQSLQEMKAIVQTPDCGSDCAYGLGIESWNVGNRKGFGKNGTSVGVEANWIFFPEKSTCLVLFKNNGNGSHKDFVEELINE